ncbi:hypothetical protein EDD18DRAFT_649652 [Armillaria luteobubalina]|uniref:Uncharacterized protein n=1 Tax=Armillaria luteobubalina TaxID=153913 RepID=A0AA39PPC4_9AGAR|nr:hypothetical protein EDD18DRAFT_649652 [Armillaria luteobubalina]
MSFLHAVRRFSTKANENSSSMLGTMPPHLCYIFLQSPQPISRFPSRIMVPIQRALQLKVTKWGALVNWAFYGAPVSENFDEVSAKAFFANGRTLDISRLTMANLDTVEEQLRDCLSGNETGSLNDALHLYVCTHGTRDCRCGTVGKDCRRGSSSRDFCSFRGRPDRSGESLHGGGGRTRRRPSICCQSSRLSSRRMVGLPDT